MIAEYPFPIREVLVNLEDRGVAGLIKSSREGGLIELLVIVRLEMVLLLERRLAISDDLLLVKALQERGVFVVSLVDLGDQQTVLLHRGRVRQQQFNQFLVNALVGLLLMFYLLYRIYDILGLVFAL